MTTTTTTASMTHTATAPTAAAPSRRLAWTGIAFVVCFIASVVASSPPKNGASDRTWIANYTGSANKTHHIATGLLLVLAALAIMTFLTMLWQRIAAAQAPASTSPLPIVAAGVGAAAIAIGGVVMGAVGTLITHHSDPGVANFYRLSNGLGFALVALAAMPAIALSVACLSVLGRRAGVLSRGVSTFGIIAAVASLAAIAFLPIILLFVWVLIVSVTWLRAG